MIRILKKIADAIALGLAFLLFLAWVGSELSGPSSDGSVSSAPARTPKAPMPGTPEWQAQQVRLDAAESDALDCMLQLSSPARGPYADVESAVARVVAPCEAPYFAVWRKEGMPAAEDVLRPLLVSLAWKAMGCRYVNPMPAGTAAPDQRVVTCSPPSRATAIGVSVIEGAIVCPDIQTVRYMFRALAEHRMDAFQEKVTNGQSALVRQPFPAPNLKQYGCGLVPAGTRILVSRGNVVPTVSAKVNGAWIDGVTLPSMIQ